MQHKIKTRLFFSTILLYTSYAYPNICINDPTWGNTSKEGDPSALQICDGDDWWLPNSELSKSGYVFQGALLPSAIPEHYPSHHLAPITPSGCKDPSPDGVGTADNYDQPSTWWATLTTQGLQTPDGWNNLDSRTSSAITLDKTIADYYNKNLSSFGSPLPARLEKIRHFCSPVYGKYIYALPDAGYIGSSAPAILKDLYGATLLHEELGFDITQNYDNDNENLTATSGDITSFCKSKYTGDAMIKCGWILGAIKDRAGWNNHYAWWKDEFLAARSDFVKSLGYFLTNFGVDPTNPTATTMVNTSTSTTGASPLINMMPMLNMNNEGTGGETVVSTRLIADYTDLDSKILSYVNANLTASTIPYSKWLINIDSGGRGKKQWADAARDNNTGIGTHGAKNVLSYQLLQHLDHIAYDENVNAFKQISKRPYPLLHADITYFGRSTYTEIEYSLFKLYAISAIALGFNSLMIQDFALPSRGVAQSSSEANLDSEKARNNCGRGYKYCTNFSWDKIKNLGAQGFLTWLTSTIGNEGNDSQEAFCNLSQTGFETTSSSFYQEIAALKDNVNPKNPWNEPWDNSYSYPLSTYRGKLCDLVVQNVGTDKIPQLKISGTPALRMDLNRLGAMPGCPASMGGEVNSAGTPLTLSEGGVCLKPLGYDQANNSINYFDGRTSSIADNLGNYKAGCLKFKFNSEWLNAHNKHGKVLKITYENIDGQKPASYSVKLYGIRRNKVIQVSDTSESSSQVRTATINLADLILDTKKASNIELCSNDDSAVAFKHIRLINNPNYIIKGHYNVNIFKPVIPAAIWKK